jgi:hypothetical protein
MMLPHQTAKPAYLPAPCYTVPEVPEYPQFLATEAPRGCGAIRAWKGVIQPFRDDADARHFLRRVEDGKPIDIVQGSVYANASMQPEHWADRWLVKMNLRFQLLVLEFEEPEHPRAYSLQPEISREMHLLHPHLRTDRVVIVGCRPIPALCVYSGATFKYSPVWPRMVQFLDQVATFLARHAIWLRTRIQLPLRFGEKCRVPQPGEPIFGQRSLVRSDVNFSGRLDQVELWEGFWPGAASPSGIENHLDSISPTQECWCCSGVKYGECHRPFELQCLRIQNLRSSGGVGSRCA